ncbi:MAG: putative portal protein [Prokaryotic dsDNA virus sp.]|nr:MAG: putative portal protein [Prokaryotic dsDNA virus sp.]|tara:strand:+ start:4187 stop:5731 length:1545 start_codon:yes stop_codon:yes gene_type:complete
MAKRGNHAITQSRDSKGRFAQSDDLLNKTKKPEQVFQPPFASVVELQRSYMSHFTKVLRRSDMALRQDRVLQRQMRRDPDIMSPLFQRQTSVALLDWEIVPEDSGDETQVEQAQELERIIRNNLRQPVEFFKSILEAVWYGASTVQLTPEVRGDDIVPGEWMPIHSDSIAFTEEGELGLYVGRRYEGKTFQAPYGLMHILEEEEREQVILHTHNTEGADYEVPEEAEYVYRGRGLRDVVWFQWVMKQTALQFWMTWIERYSMGIRVGTYPDGNASAQSVMQDIMENLVGDVSILVPKQSGGEDLYSVDIKEVNGNNAKIFADLIEGYLAGQIKELIIGQTATTEQTATGLGSSVADQHAETFRRIIETDAIGLADTLTVELARKYHRYNFGETDYQPRFQFSLEKNNPREFMEGVRSFVDLGGSVSQRQAREILGIIEPEEGEEILSSQQAQQQQMMQEQQQAMGQPQQGQPKQNDIMSQLFGGGMPKPPNAEKADKAFKEFAKSLQKHNLGKK